MYIDVKFMTAEKKLKCRVESATANNSVMLTPIGVNHFTYVDHIQPFAHQETTPTDLKLIFGTLSVVVCKTTATLLSPIESIIHHEHFDCVKIKLTHCSLSTMHADVSVELYCWIWSSLHLIFICFVAR